MFLDRWRFYTENDKEDSQCILLAAYPKIEGVILLPKWKGWTDQKFNLEEFLLKLQKYSQNENNI